MKKIDYIACIDSAGAPGVINKIKQTVSALNRIGHQAEAIFLDIRERKGYFKAYRKIFKSEADIVVIRSTLALPFFFTALLFKRLQGKKVLIDVPTPNITFDNELRISKAGLFWKITRRLLLRAAFPWALYPATKVFQYAKDSAYFSFGLQRKTMLIANGIDVSAIPVRTFAENPSTTDFVIIGVGSLATWHGFDRVIRGMATYYKKCPNGINVRFFVVGNGDIRGVWQKKAEDLGISRHVVFTGLQTGAALDELFEQASVAVASLGLFRKGISMASDLKSREYSARGMPFIASGHDIDFDPAPEFLYKVDNSDDEVSIEKLLKWHAELQKKNITPDVIRNYAANHLDFSVKAKDFLD